MKISSLYEHHTFRNGYCVNISDFYLRIFLNTNETMYQPPTRSKILQKCPYKVFDRAIRLKSFFINKKINDCRHCARVNIILDLIAGSKNNVYA